MLKQQNVSQNVMLFSILIMWNHKLPKKKLKKRKKKNLYNNKKKKMLLLQLKSLKKDLLIVMLTSKYVSVKKAVHGMFSNLSVKILMKNMLSTKLLIRDTKLLITLKKITLEHLIWPVKLQNKLFRRLKAGSDGECIKIKEVKN